MTIRLKFLYKVGCWITKRTMSKNECDRVVGVKMDVM